MHHFQTLLSIVLVALAVFTIGANTIRVVRKRSVEGVAPAAILMSFCGASSWAAYGAENGNVVQVLVNLLNVTGFVTILWIGQRTGAIRAHIPIGGALIYATMVTIIMSFAGLNGLGVVVSMLTFVCRAPQIHKSWMQPGGDGISVSGQAADAGQCGGWLIMGLIIADPFMIATSAYCMSASIFVALRALNARTTLAPIIEMTSNDEDEFDTNLALA